MVVIVNILQKSLSTVVLSLLISQIYAANERGFAALAGCIPDEIQELVSYSKISTANNSQYMAKLPKGILLAGPTGSGKTSMAKALSEDLGCPFIYRSACNLDRNAILDLFNEARNKAKSSSCGKTIIFIDDFDIWGGHQINR